MKFLEIELADRLEDGQRAYVLVGVEHIMAVMPMPDGCTAIAVPFGEMKTREQYHDVVDRLEALGGQVKSAKRLAN